MVDFLVFRRMITAVIVQALFCIGVVASVVIGMRLIAAGSGANRRMGFAILAGGPLVARIYCELLILLFRMNQALNDIRSSLTPSRE